MRVVKYEPSKEKLVVSAALTNKSVLAAVAARWDGSLFTSRATNTVVGWAVEHYNTYGTVPKDLTVQFEKWAETNSDESQARMMDRILTGLSAEKKVKHNVSYLLDLASEVINKNKLKGLVDSVGQEIEADRVAQAAEAVEKFRPVSLSEADGIDVWSDEAAYVKAWEQSQDNLFDFEGALGNFTARAFQRSNFVSFMGREKIGKCVAHDTEVLMADGSVRTIEDICTSRSTDAVLSMDTETRTLRAESPDGWWDNGVRTCWRMETYSGRTVTTTGNHKYYTPEGWKPLDEVKSGDWVAVPRRTAAFGNRPMPEARLKFLAYMLADGCARQVTNFTKADPGVAEDFSRACHDLGITTRRKGITTHLSGAREVLRSLGLWDVKSKDKAIPPELFRCPKEQVAMFLRLFFTCEGSALTKGGYKVIELTLASEKLIRQVSHLLHRFGVLHTLRYKDSKCKGKTFPSWRILIGSAEHADLFLRKIGFAFGKATAPNGSSKSRSFLDKLPATEAAKLCEEIVRETGVTLTGVLGRNGASSVRAETRKGSPLMKQSFAAARDTKAFARHFDSDMMWERVLSVTNVGKKKTYDISVPGNHNFVAQDCIVHNSYWLMHCAFTAVLQNCNVAYFEVGDSSQEEVLHRLAARIAGRPVEADNYVRYPVAIGDSGDKDRHVEHEIKRYRKRMRLEKMLETLKEFREQEGVGKFKLSCHPNSSISVKGIAAILDKWRRDDFVPDCIIVDYADILAAMDGKKDERHQINDTWKALRSLSQKYHCLVITATQTDAASYDAEILTRKNFSEDKRKYAHVTGMLGINQTSAEQAAGLYRLNWVILRKLAFSERKVVHCAGCLSLSNPAVLSSL